MAIDLVRPLQVGDTGTVFFRRGMKDFPEWEGRVTKVARRYATVENTSGAWPRSLDFDKDNGLERTNANSIGSPCVFRTVEQVAHEEARAAAYAVLADVGLKPDGYQGHGLSSEMLFALAATAKEVSGS
jgi:hypothetical protein